MAIGAGLVAMIPLTTSLWVPSPPRLSSSVAPSETARVASSTPCPLRSVRHRVTGPRCSKSWAETRSQCRATRPPAAAGLTITTVLAGSNMGRSLRPSGLPVTRAARVRVGYVRGVKQIPELVLMGGDGRPERSFVIGTRHLSVGRAPDNDLMIPDPGVSRHHLILWATDSDIFLQDLGSANGTYLDGHRVVDVVSVPLGTPIRLGKRFELMVRGSVHQDEMYSQFGVALEDVASGLHRPLHGARFVIGSGHGADVRLNEGPEQAALLMIDPEGEIWLSTDDDDREIEVDEVFEVGGATFRVVDIDSGRMATIQPEGNGPAYRLRVALDAPGGAVATVENLAGSDSHQVTAENRVVLMYVLARKILEDREAGVDAADQGWCEDVDVIVGVWGRTALDSGSNRLKVLVHRVRKELCSSGLSADCIEKRAGLIRGRFVEVEVE